MNLLSRAKDLRVFVYHVSSIGNEHDFILAKPGRRTAKNKGAGRLLLLKRILLFSLFCVPQSPVPVPLY